MRVGLDTTWNTPCGIAEYAKNLVENVPDVDWKILNERGGDGLIKEVQDCDIVHFNYEPSLFTGLTYADISQLAGMGKKIMATWHATSSEYNRDWLSQACDAVVVHEYTKDRFRLIPMPIPDGLVDESEPENAIGMIGFPFHYKAMTEIAKAAKVLEMDLLGILPIYPNGAPECEQQLAKIQEIMDGKARLVTEWLPKEDAIRRLGKAKVMVQCMIEGYPPYGISSSVRYALATGRRTVVNKHRMYRDLYDYPSEVWVAEHPQVDSLVQTIRLALNSDNRPKTILEDMGWKSAGRKYYEIYKELSN